MSSHPPVMVEASQAVQLQSAEREIRLSSPGLGFVSLFQVFPHRCFVLSLCTEQIAENV